MVESRHLPSMRHAKKRTESNAAAVATERPSSDVLTGRSSARAVEDMKMKTRPSVVAVGIGSLD